MLSEEEFLAWCELLDLKEPARKFINNIRVSPPARRVKSGAGNVHGFYPSKKMGLTINFESHTVELPMIFEFEHDQTVLEYYDQPCAIKLNYISASGKPVGVQHVPDFFIIRKDSAGFEECKPEEKLIELSVKSPNRYIRQPDGSWRCPPGEEFAAQYGLYYRIRSSKDIDWTYQNNVRFLEDYTRDENLNVSDDASGEIVDSVRQQPGMSLYDLIMKCSRATSDDVYAALLLDHIYIDLTTCILSKPKHVQVFINAETSVAYDHIIHNSNSSIHASSNSIHVSVGSQVVWDSVNWTIINVGEEAVSLQSAEGTIANLPYSVFDELLRQSKISKLSTATFEDQKEDAYDIISKASPDDLNVAVFRYEVVQSVLGGLSLNQHQVPERTVRRWIKSYKIALQVYGNGFVGLIPETRNKGNRRAKLAERVKQIMNEVIEEDYETHKQIDRKTAYGVVCNRCEQEGLISPSYRTFCNMINLRPQLELLRNRRGPKAAYAMESWYWYLDPTIPKHGGHPWEICHMDHTEIDLELVDDGDNEGLGRAYLSVMIDAFSRKVLAFDISFEKPSYRSCMKVVRDCVRRHGRLPVSIIVDGGKEFHSVYFDSLLANYDCIKKTRPPGEPKFGSVIERLFGSLNTMLFYKLSGNTQITHDDVRKVTQDVNPKRLANWTLPRLYSRLNEFFFQIYETLKHSTLKMSPRDAFNQGIKLSGHRPYRRIAYNQSFIMTTLPTTRKGTVKIDISRGVKVSYIYYWSPIFKNPKSIGSQVPVRYDPYDMGTVYVYIFNQWVRCLSEYHLVFRGRTERELALAAEIIRKQDSNYSRHFAVSAAKLAAFFKSAEAEELLAMQRARDRAAKQIPDSVADTGHILNTFPTSNDEPLISAQDIFTDDGPNEEISPAGVYEL